MSLQDPLSIRQLEVFVALVEHGSFTQAARHLGLSQSTASGHMADLERRLKLRLVDRSRHGVTLTSAGSVLLKPARETLRAELNTRMSAAELTGLLRGQVSIGGSSIPSVYILPRHLAAFRSEHPEISLDLRTGNSREILESVQQGDIDIGVIGLKPPIKRLTSRVLGHDTLSLIVAPSHPFAQRQKVRLDEVAGQAMVLRSRGSGTRAAIIDALMQALPSTHPEVACEVGSTEAIKAAVRAGIGISFVSSLAIQDEIASGSLVRVDVESFAVHRPFYLVTRPDMHLSPASRAFRDLLESRARDGAREAAQS